MARAALIAALAALVAGCGASDAPITAGGRIVGDAVTVYSSLPDPGRGASRDMVEAQKLALLKADGRAGQLDVNFVSVDEGAPGADEPREVAASAAEEVIRDPQVMAVIGALRSQTALTSIPLFNAAGILHLSPGAGYAGFTSPVAPGEPERWFPSPRPNFSRLIADDTRQAAALLAAARGRVLVEAEAGRVPEALAAAIVAADEAGRIVDDPALADTVIYAGTDVESAAGVAEATGDAALVFGDVRLQRAGARLHAGAAAVRGRLPRPVRPPPTALRGARMAGDEPGAGRDRARRGAREPPPGRDPRLLRAARRAQAVHHLPRPRPPLIRRVGARVPAPPRARRSPATRRASSTSPRARRRR